VSEIVKERNEDVTQTVKSAQGYEFLKGIPRRLQNALEKVGALEKTEAHSPLLLEGSGEAFAAIVIASGTPTARNLKAPGRELKGIHFALELLSQQNRVLAGMEFSKDERITAKGKDVLVIGGGDTGSDCIGTAHRQGCKSVTQIEIMPKPVEGPEDPQNPWPNWPRTLKTTSSHEEGCIRRWNINTLEFLGENGKLTGVKVQEIDWKPNPEGGRPIMVEKGEPEIIKAELVLLAMGFLKPEHPAYPENVFICGDSANGASLVVRAMASGLQTAQKVDSFLRTQQTKS
jgi:glutamate synthase (NADPH/NADH) small chain